MRQIREGIFETNSSSCHAVAVRRENSIGVCYLRPQEDGYIHVPLDEFGWNYDGDLYGQEMRLSYLLTLAAQNEDCTNFWDDETDDKCRSRFERTKWFKKIEAAVLEVCEHKCKGIYIDTFGGHIDHQSVEPTEDFLDWWNLSIEEFVFGTNVELIIDNDNH